jgi:hypothetical protein
METLSPMIAISLPMILVRVVVVYFATLMEVQLRETGTSLMGLKLGVSLRRMLLTLGPPETSSTEAELEMLHC